MGNNDGADVGTAVGPLLGDDDGGEVGNEVGA